MLPFELYLFITILSIKSTLVSSVQTFKLGVPLISSAGTPYDMERIGPAIDIAIERVNRDILNGSYQLVTIKKPYGKFCSGSTAPAVERRRRRRQRRWWTRPWLSPERRCSFGLYDQLMTELRWEDRQSFVHFLRMPTEMFDEILQVGPRIAKQNTFYRNPLEPGLKLAITLRHLASGAKYRSMQYG
ncbi:Hypothetical predicted protein [Mytilus galloprovincialis]|uniref:Uncharacterized protein n=1 Tax=Mytilus galloprovincialis TaxID=29158 RepID=A0A8B6GCB0_MYTGA|nr:Hypothetical predicted protein [Mytilus galloprovincialis]